MEFGHVSKSNMKIENAKLKMRFAAQLHKGQSEKRRSGAGGIQWGQKVRHGGSKCGGKYYWVQNGYQ